MLPRDFECGLKYDIHVYRRFYPVQGFIDVLILKTSVNFGWVTRGLHILCLTILLVNLSFIISRSFLLSVRNLLQVASAHSPFILHNYVESTIKLNIKVIKLY